VHHDTALIFGTVEVIVYRDNHGDPLERVGRLRLALT
jgi:hypothetical protein